LTQEVVVFSIEKLQKKIISILKFSLFRPNPRDNPLSQKEGKLCWFRGFGYGKKGGVILLIGVIEFSERFYLLMDSRCNLFLTD